MDMSLTAPLEKPRNGIAGLKEWRYDLTAGLKVSLISLPFSLGIAIAWGAPLTSGLMSTISAGLERIPIDAKDVRLHLGENVAMIDHTSLDSLFHFREEAERSQGVNVEIIGLELMRKPSHAETSMRLAPLSTSPPVLSKPGVNVNGNGNGNGNGHLHEHPLEDSLSDVQSVD